MAKTAVGGFTYVFYQIAVIIAALKRFQIKNHLKITRSWCVSQFVELIVLDLSMSGN